MKPTRCIITKRHATPCGELLLGDWQGELCLCDWRAARNHALVLERLQAQLGAPVKMGHSPLLQQVERELLNYFAGRQDCLKAPLTATGTEFQLQVWEQLLGIPYGSTISYGELAGKMGDTNAARAVANACSANIISLYIPCHRVVGSSSTLGGYGGGLDAKRRLLDLEAGRTLTLQSE